MNASKIFVSLLVGFNLLGLGQVIGQDNKESKPMSNSILLKPWSGPYGGVPPWDLIRPPEFNDAFDAAITLAAKEIHSIAENNDETANVRKY